MFLCINDLEFHLLLLRIGWLGCVITKRPVTNQAVPIFVFVFLKLFFCGLIMCPQSMNYHQRQYISLGHCPERASYEACMIVEEQDLAKKVTSFCHVRFIYLSIIC